MNNTEQASHPEHNSAQEPDLLLNLNQIQPATQAPKTQAHCWPDNRGGFSEHEQVTLRLLRIPAAPNVF